MKPSTPCLHKTTTLNGNNNDDNDNDYDDANNDYDDDEVNDEDDNKSQGTLLEI